MTFKKPYSWQLQRVGQHAGMTVTQTWSEVGQHTGIIPGIKPQAR